MPETGILTKILSRSPFSLDKRNLSPHCQNLAMLLLILFHLSL